MKSKQRQDSIKHHPGYTFIDRSKGRRMLCMILAGYKRPLWEDVFARIAAYIPDNIDVCVLSSGVYSKELEKISEEHDWSYLRTGRNQLCAIQNLAIRLHGKAEWIYKIDEDIFITAGFFEKLRETMEYADRHMHVSPSAAAPLINVNGYCYVRLLEKCGLLENFEERFGQAVISSGIKHHGFITEDPDFAGYMWGSEEKALADIDALTGQFSAEQLSVSVCPVRFSIGAIYFSREIWTEIGGFPVDTGNGLGKDEQYLCREAADKARPVVVCENVVAGHLGYGPQTDAMMRFYRHHRDIFRLKDQKDNPEAYANKKDICIMVACHRDSDTPSSAMYCPVEAGASSRRMHLPDLIRDDTGDNISDLNRSFSELTVQYWAWKNLDAEIFGICHYRRYFYLGDREFKANDHAQIETDHLDRDTVTRYLMEDDDLVRDTMREYDLVAPVSWDVSKVRTPKGCFDTVRDHMEGYGLVSERDIEYLTELTDRLVPEWSKLLRDYLNGSTYIGYNCFLMKKDLFMDLCDKEFRILLEFIRKDEWDGGTDRLCGYLGEILFSVFVMSCEEKGIRVRRAPLVFIRSPKRVIKDHLIESAQKGYVRLLPPGRKYMNRKFEDVREQISSLKELITDHFEK